MMVKIVQLKDGTVGQVMNVYADGSVNIWLKDETGNRIEKDGEIECVLEEYDTFER